MRFFQLRAEERDALVAALSPAAQAQLAADLVATQRSLATAIATLGAVEDLLAKTVYAVALETGYNDPLEAVLRKQVGHADSVKDRALGIRRNLELIQAAVRRTLPEPGPDTPPPVRDAARLF